MKKAGTLCAVVVCLALATTAAFSQQPTSPQNPPKQSFQQPRADVSQDVPAEMRAAMDKLTSSRNDLMHDGSEWRGFREQAVENVNQVIANLNKATHYHAQNMPKQ